MLAKDIKIKTLKMQREFIEDALSQVATHTTDGDASYIYIGHIYPEVILYFEENGFKVCEIKSDTLTSIAKGRPIHLFTVNDDIILTADEIQEAEEYHPTDLFSSLFNPNHE